MLIMLFLMRLIMLIEKQKQIKIIRQGNNSFIDKNEVNMGDISVDKVVKNFELIDFMEGENKSMMPAYKAREISQRCGEYMNKLDNYKRDLDSLIRTAALVGKTVIEFEIKEKEDKNSIVNDLKRELAHEKYSVYETVTPEKHILNISW